MAAQSGWGELGWSELQEDLLCVIGQRVITLQDVIRSRAVCSSWRRALRAEQQRRFPASTQWLMLPYCTSKNMKTESTPMIGCKGSKSCGCFYDVVVQQFHHIDFPQDLQRKSCRGSAFGWLFMVGKTPAISLLNPLTKAEFALPPITSFPDILGYHPENAGSEYLLRDATGVEVLQSRNDIERNYITRIAMSAEPMAEECVVMAIRFSGGGYLAFCKPKGEEWTTIPNCLSRPIAFIGVVYWRNQFYGVDLRGRVFVCDLSDPHRPTMSVFLDLNLDRVTICLDRYLVISPAAAGDDVSDQLMMVTRHTQDNDDHIRQTVKFRVFKLHKDGNGWDEVENIGDFALFFGFNSPTFLSIADHSDLTPNSICFTHDLIELKCDQRPKHPGHDMGIYNLATHTIQPLYSTTSLHNNPLKISPMPVWFSPTTSPSEKATGKRKKWTCTVSEEKGKEEIKQGKRRSV